MPVPATDPLSAAIAMVRARSAGRTRYAGQTPFHEELLVAEIVALRAAVRDAYMTLDNFGIGTEWELRHAAVLARAGEAEHG
jgi:hypothetical protein